LPEGKTVKNRLHLDLATTDWETEIDRLTDLGATRIREVKDNGAQWITMADPEGNEFDLVRR
jgi:predicted enzyme related to lactoylglutathione lyase